LRFKKQKWESRTVRENHAFGPLPACQSALSDIRNALLAAKMHKMHSAPSRNQKEMDHGFHGFHG